ncbi:MAG: DUF5667 domain-containing protein, partial [Candidatus Nanohaloarchaea archaeon]|nr:DUF5667 domain-containing protein [Candidatus Nanohaloarchaea archaeon]
MRRTALLMIAALIVGFPAVAANQHQTQTPKIKKAGTVPGSPFYAVDTLTERVGLALTFSKKAKAKKKVKIAEERLAEARKLQEQGKTQLAQKTEQKYSDNIQEAQNFGQAIAKAAKQRNIEEVISKATSIHMQVLAQKNVTPGQVGYNAKRTAEDLTVATENDPVKKAEKQADVAGHRAQEAKILAQQNRTQEASQVAQEYQQEMQKLQKISNNVSEAATRHQIQEVVARATQHHTKVLSTVYKKVPPQAQDAIKQAMQRSMRGHQQAVQALKKSPGGLPSGIQEQIPSKNIP